MDNSDAKMEQILEQRYRIGKKEVVLNLREYVNKRLLYLSKDLLKIDTNTSEGRIKHLMGKALLDEVKILDNHLNNLNKLID